MARKSKLEASIDEMAKQVDEEDKAEPNEKEETEEKIETLETAEKEKDDEKADSDDDKGRGSEKDEAESKEGEGQPGGRGAGDKGTEGKEEVLADTEQPKNEDWARIRRENRRLKALAAAASAPPAPAPVEAKPVVDRDPQPDRTIDPDSWRDWKDRQIEAKVQKIESFTANQQRQQEQAEIYTKAGQELNGYVKEFTKEFPDTTAVLDHAASRWQQSLKDINPGMSDTEVNAAFGKFVLTQAAFALKRGEDPAEALYNMAVERYGRPQAPKTEQKQELRQKPNLQKIDASRRKSATPLQGGGQGSENMTLTKAAVASMPLHEFANVDPKLLAQLEGEPD